jgi:hypothetical protein
MAVCPIPTASSTCLAAEERVYPSDVENHFPDAAHISSLYKQEISKLLNPSTYNKEK